MKNKKGFTLVELLAVIVIMGILMMIAIPAVSRIIENVRKDSFINTARSYANAAKTMWTADSLTCEGTSATAVDDGDYYILINTEDSARSTLPELIGQGGKSSWGNRDVNGYVRVHVETIIDNNGEPQRKTTFYVALSDGVHAVLDDNTISSDDLKRGNVKVDISDTDKKKVELSLGNGSLDCSKTNLGTYVCTEVTPVKSITGLCVDDSSSAQVNGSVNINTVSFAEDDWSTILTVVKNGAASHYKIGDTKEIDLGDELGKHIIRVANNSTPAECNQEGFSQTACGFVVEFADVIVKYDMNSDYTNVGGWPASDLRAYLNSNIYNALPADLQSIIIDTKVISGHGSDDPSNFTTTDKLYLLSTAEVWAQGTSSSVSYDTGRDCTRQLDYYAGVTTDNYSKAMKKLNGSNAFWWLRTPYSNSNYDFYYVPWESDWSIQLMRIEPGISPAFRIG